MQALIMGQGPDGAAVPVKVAADGTLAGGGGGGGGGGGDASAANQATQIALETAINNKLPALSGGRVPVTTGSATGAGTVDANTLRVTLADDGQGVTRLGAITETAPASDTASSGLNGRLQRIAQRLTALIALLPTSLGTKAAAASLSVTVASDQARINVEPLGLPGVARQITAGAASGNTVLTVGVGRISIYCRNADCRYSVGSASQTANNATSHFIAAGERIDIDVPATPNIGVIRAAHSTVDGILEVTELS